MKKLILLAVALSLCVVSMAQQSRNNVPYRPGDADRYAAERCVLDVYVPAKADNPVTIVWFHGGGLTGGEKFIPEILKDKNIVIVAPNYRLSPKAKAPAYIDDAAAAVAWAFLHCGEWGGSAGKIYVSGHSAGGYLALMLALDKSYLAKYDVDADKVAGYLPVSGQTVTHNAIRAERGLDQNVPLVDALAPLNNARKVAAPIVLITGERTLELTSRYEENAYLYSTLRSMGNDVALYEMQGFDHNTVVAPASYIILEKVRK